MYPRLRKQTQREKWRNLRALIDWGSKLLAFALLKKLLFGDVDILCKNRQLLRPAN